MNKLLVGILALGFCARGQGLEDRRVGVFLGYDFADAVSPVVTAGRTQFYGIDLGVYVRQNRWLRWRVDVSGGGGNGTGPGLVYGLGGPEFTASMGRGIFFAHSLFGYGEVNGGLFNPTRSGFAMAFGGGVDLRLTSWFSLRLIDADYVPSHFTGPAYVGFFSSQAPQVTQWDSNTRVSFGAIFKFGKKF